MPRVWRGVGGRTATRSSKERGYGMTAVEYLGILSDARYTSPLPPGYPRGKREPPREATF